MDLSNDLLLNQTPPEFSCQKDHYLWFGDRLKSPLETPLLLPISLRSWSVKGLTSKEKEENKEFLFLAQADSSATHRF